MKYFGFRMLEEVSVHTTQHNKKKNEDLSGGDEKAESPHGHAL